MIEAVFISDLHLHPDDKEIRRRFNGFVSWAQNHVKAIYILGDFFHAWAGDDSINEWSRSIANQLHTLTENGISLYYIHGNRDFLLGKKFAALAGWQILAEPTLIQLGDEQIMLAHGDRYCIKDKAHQRFRRLTRNRLFSTLFLSCSLAFRERVVNQVRTISLSNQTKTMDQMDVVGDAIIQHMMKYKVNYLIHGHTHKPGLNLHQMNSYEFKQYVLSDWDDTPQLLCYDNTKGFHFVQIEF